MECQICKKEFNNFKGLAAHIRHSHKSDKKTYYDMHIKQGRDGYCKTCNEPTKFRGLGGYATFCSKSCRSADEEYRKNCALPKLGKKQSDETIRKRIANTDQSLKEKNRIKSLQERYGEDVVNPSQTPSYRENYTKTSLMNWGAKHPSSAPDSFRTKRQYKKRTVVIDGHTFSDIQGYEDVFLEQLNILFPNVTYENLLEERSKTLFRKNGSVHYPDFFSKKHNHMFEVKSEWTFENNKEDALLKKAEAEEQGYLYNIIIWKRRSSKPRII